jgi:sarcosine oxidase, subunit beta
MERADAVVVGGGAMGAAALHYLVELGCERPLLVERDTLGSGSTGFCAGGVRTMFSDELNVRIGLESIRRLERFTDDTGGELDLRLFGYLFLLDDEEDVERYRDAVALQEELGIDSALIDPEQARQIVPQLDVDGVLACAHNRVAGYVTPDLVVQAYARHAAERGARIVQSCAATRILVDNGRVRGVETSRGPVETERVVLTAGVWSRELAATARLDLPVVPEQRWMFFTGDAPGFPHELPLTIDFSTGFYFHREGDGLAIGGREQTIEELAPAALRRLPALAELGIQSSWWGYYEMSPDHNALVGEAPEAAGLLYATGFSGHGFQQAPVIGEHLAQRALGLEPTFDLSVFDAARFAAGSLRAEHNVV